MKFDKETIIILTTCMLLMLAWPWFSQKMGWTKAAPAESAAVKQTAAPAPAVVPQAAKPAVEAVLKAAAPAVERTVFPDRAIENESMKVVVSGEYGAISSISFRKYLDNDQNADIRIAPYDAKRVWAYPGRLFFPGVTVASTMLGITGSDSGITAMRQVSCNGSTFLIEQRFELKNSTDIFCKYTVRNPGKTPAKVPAAVFSGGEIAPWHVMSGDKVRSMNCRVDLMTANGSFEDVDANDDDEDFYLNPVPQVRWAGGTNKYFALLLKQHGADYRLWQERAFLAGDKNKPLITAGASLPEQILAPGEAKTVEFTIYAGVKNADNLAAFAGGAEKTIRLAWGPLNYLARFLQWLLNMFYSLCGSYGISIILLTLLVRTVFYPITARGNESMKKMQKVQPKFKELREKYKDNPQLLNQKMSELYRQEGVNPFAGCLPILLQIPIFFALYAMLDNVIALRHVSFLWCKNLAAADTVCSIPLYFDLPLIGNHIPVNPLVLTMTALMVVQQRMTPMAMDPAQKKMMALMPVFMLIFLYDLPSGLTLYWTVSNIFSIAQLWMQKRRRQAASSQ